MERDELWEGQRMRSEEYKAKDQEIRNLSSEWMAEIRRRMGSTTKMKRYVVNLV